MEEKNAPGILHSLFYSTLGVIALCAVVLTANAVNNAPAPEAKTFPMLDKNLNGFIDRKEAEASPTLMAVFDEADTNKDARLSPEEYAKAFSAKPPAKPAAKP